jgi:hypothetical protein
LDCQILKLIINVYLYHNILHMSKSIELEGVIKEVFENEIVSPKLTLRRFVLTTDPQGSYPQHVLIQLANNRTSLLDEFYPGDSVRVTVNIQGRRFEKPDGVKYYNSIEAWKIERA